MTWEEISQWHAAGMEVGAHTVSHVDLTALSVQVLFDEVGGNCSVATLLHILGADCTVVMLEVTAAYRPVT